MKRFNIFTLLMVVAFLEAGLRLFDVSTVISPATAESAPPATALQSATDEKKTDAAAPAAAPVAADAATPAAPAQAAAPIPPPPPGGDRAFSAAEIDVLQSLAKRRDDLDSREQGLAKREALLKAAEGEVDRKIAELNKLKGDLEGLLSKQQAAENKHIDSLVKIYEGMKPKEAARIFDTLDMDVLMQVLGKMSERKSSPIIAQMDPDKARQVTVKMSEQQKLPSKPDAADKKPAAAQ